MSAILYACPVFCASIQFEENNQKNRQTDIRLNWVETSSLWHLSCELISLIVFSCVYCQASLSSVLRSWSDQPSLEGFLVLMGALWCLDCLCLFCFFPIVQVLLCLSTEQKDHIIISAALALAPSSSAPPPSPSPSPTQQQQHHLQSLVFACLHSSSSSTSDGVCVVHHFFPFLSSLGAPIDCIHHHQLPDSLIDSACASLSFSLCTIWLSLEAASTRVCCYIVSLFEHIHRHTETAHTT